MNELQLYRVTAVQVVDLRRHLSLNATVLTCDRGNAVRAACLAAGYTSISHAAASAGLDYFELMRIILVTEIEERIHSVPVPVTEEAVDLALMMIASACETLPPVVAKAVELRLAAERLKRRHGGLPDDLDLSWISGLVGSFNGPQLYVIE